MTSYILQTYFGTYQSRKCLAVFLWLLLIQVSFSPLLAQTLWPQFGMAYKTTVGGFALESQTHLQGLELWLRPLPKYSFSIQYLSNQPVPFTHAATQERPLPLQQVDVMMGKTGGEYLLRWHAHGGLGAIWGIRFADDGLSCDRPSEMLDGPFCTRITESFWYPSVSGKVGVKFVPAHYLSLGLDLQTILTPAGGTFFPMLSAEIGLLRDSVWLRRRYSLTQRKRYNKVF
ncbi:MAG TPA: hypothetical protein DCE41_26240 [Cytophagales bacterium]|nr:hypothetical protein [Cytophagales bacterium]HAA22416.1 hypothetical protein [Cytophagales bacterium]HAP65134.1 hypothetical protein [Cytophagales bacterium]